MDKEAENLPQLGWREWASLPGLGINRIKIKIDTGARTSAIHAFSVRRFTKKGVKMVRFKVHPIQNNNDVITECEALIVDDRYVTDSGGHKEKRPVILTTINLGTESWDIEATLTKRDIMKFRMLLGRHAIKNRFLVNAGKSYLMGK
ncbi:MAG: ATP-dependent zinc protease [Nitrospinae bacterium]|nr:ATP-dependent zinc protease [Nitrospinota bacterium]